RTAEVAGFRLACGTERRRRLGRAFFARRISRVEYRRAVVEAARFRQAVIANTLRSCQIFVGLSAADIESVAAMAIPKHLAKGEYLFRKGEPAIGFYVMQKGAINIH